MSKIIPVLNPVFVECSPRGRDIKQAALKFGNKIGIAFHEILAMTGDAATDIGTIVMRDGTVIEGRILDAVEV